MFKVLAIGDAMLDVVVKIDGPVNFDSDTRAEISTHSGGAGANTAAWLAKLGIESHFVGRVGADSAGDLFRSELERSGVSFHSKAAPVSHTGSVVVIVGGDGARTMFPDAGANDEIRAADLPDLSDFDAIYLSGYSLFNPTAHREVLAMIARVRECGKRLFFDPASVGIIQEFGVAAALELLANFDLVSLNEDEAYALTGASKREDALGLLLERAPIVALKRGAAGAELAIRGGEKWSHAAQQVQVVDTTGAGDAFNAGLLAGWVAGGDLSAALTAAISSASECVANIGARPRVAAR